MKKTNVTIVILLIAAAGAGAGRAPAGPPAPIAPPIVNEMIDLLDEDVWFQGDTEQNRWESPVFDTSRFTWIGLRVYGDLDGILDCAVAWQLTPEDAFRVSSPRLEVGSAQYPRPQLLPVTETEVRGLRAKVICRTTTTLFPGVPPATGMLTDVKVLLRR